MSNSSILLVLTEEFYPINRNYYFAAIQHEILMSIALIPNLYFLYAILTSTPLKKRKLFKRTVLVFNILNIICITTCLTVSSYYLSEYHNEGLIKLQPLWFLQLKVFIIFNFPSFMMIAGMFFQSNIQWIPDEVCTLIKIPTSSTVNQITGMMYYFVLVVPLIVGIINFFMIKRLNSQASTNLHSKSKQIENKTIFINLIIQTIQPFFGQWPALLLFFYLRSTGNNIYIIWRIFDGLVALSLVLNILFSIIFIEDVRNTIFRRESNKVVNKVVNVVPIKTDN